MQTKSSWLMIGLAMSGMVIGYSAVVWTNGTALANGILCPMHDESVCPDGSPGCPTNV